MTDWRLLAACRGCDPGLWFPGQGGGGAKAAAAVRICAACPVAPECLAFAMHVESLGTYRRYGIWGGLTPVQREQLSRERRKKKEEE